MRYSVMGRLEYNDTEQENYALVTQVQALFELIFSQFSDAALLLISTPKMSSPLRFTDEEILAKESNGTPIPNAVLERRKILMEVLNKDTVGIVNVITNKQNFKTHSGREQILEEKGILFLKDDTQDLCGATMLFKLADSILKVGIEQGQFDSNQTKRVVSCAFYETLASADYSEVLKCSNKDPRLFQMLEKFA